MNSNMSGVDRVLRTVIGLALIVWVLFYQGPVWAWLGVLPLTTAMFNYCPAYAFFKINTCQCK